MKLDTTNTKLVIFDMDGVIFNTEELFMKLLIKNTAKRGYVLTEKMYTDTIGLAGDKLINQMYDFFGNNYPFYELSNETRNDIATHISENGIEVKSGIRELLIHLNDKNITCVVASSTNSKYVFDYLESAGLSQYFKAVFGGEMVENSKPAPDIFLKAMNDSGFDSSQSLVIEDSQNGILAAYNASIPVVCIPDLKYPMEEYASKTVGIVDNAGMLVECF